jgi:predicted nucleic acid-binding protein
MANYLLDTTVIIDYLRGESEKVKFIKKLASDGCLLGCCLVNIIEVCAGMREREREATEEILDSLEYYEVTKEIAKKAGQYKRVYREKGVTLSLPDVVIAAIAISHNLTLVTDNLKHYPMPEIRIRQIETRSRG